MNVKGNQRYRETHDAILETILRFLQKQELGRITVSQICREIGINRTTFYEHFQDIPDVIEQTEKEYVRQIAKIIADEPQTPMKEKKIKVLAFIRDNRFFFGCYLNTDRTIDIPDELLVAYLSAGKKRAASFLPNDPVLTKYLWEATKANFNAVVREWVSRDCAEEPEQIADILLRTSNIWKAGTKGTDRH